MQVAACPTVEVVSESDIVPAFIEKEKKIEAQAETTCRASQSR